MARNRAIDDDDRFLVVRDGNYYYKRRVPVSVAGHDKRSPVIRASLKTDDRKVARRKRDLLEQADNALWASLVVDGPSDLARRRYEAAVKQVEALGLHFRPGAVFEDPENFTALVERLRGILHLPLDKPFMKPLLGAVDIPRTTVTQAFDLYCDEIVADELTGKSRFQRQQWKKVKRRAVNNFVLLVGDKPMEDITIDDAKTIYRHWLARIAPKDGLPTASFSSGNRDLGNMRVLYDAYFRHMGDRRRANPFEGLNFSTRKKQKRPPFPTDWIVGTILEPTKLAGLNDEARAIVLIMIETGARPSEICNLQASAIHLDHPVPHLSIEPRDDPDDPREIKTESSRRTVPLVGVALEAARRHPGGFPRYRDGENTLSATLNKYFKENGLFPTNRHKVYSLRHSFEDRMKNGGLGDDLRRILMGHAIDRPDYGTGGALEWRRAEIMKIVLPFDPSIV